MLRKPFLIRNPNELILLDKVQRSLLKISSLTGCLKTTDKPLSPFSRRTGTNYQWVRLRTKLLKESTRLTHLSGLITSLKDYINKIQIHGSTGINCLSMAKTYLLAIVQNKGTTKAKTSMESINMLPREVAEGSTSKLRNCKEIILNRSYKKI